MSDALARCRSKLGTLGLGARCALLALAVIAFYPLAATYLHARHGTAGLLAAAVAAVVCLAASMSAMVLTAKIKGTQAALYSLLFGMALRTGVPLVVGTVLQQRGGMLAEAGVFGAIVAYYLLTLVLETWLVLPLVKRQNAAPETV